MSLRPAFQPDQWLGRKLSLTIDRPLGTPHPRDPDMIYPINSGYVPGTRAGDGHPVDAYVIDLNEPVDACQARCIAILHRRDDVEDKLVCVVAEGDWTDAAIYEKTRFQEQFFDTILIRDVG